MAVIHAMIPQNEYQWFIQTVQQRATFQTQLMRELIEFQLQQRQFVQIMLTPVSPPCDIQVRIDDQLKQQVQRYLKRYGITLTLFIRLAIRQSMEEPKYVKNQSSN